ncbi:bifunctional UDP-N-acetylglucosamine diphosphorylase/glucosamine-1-phosphate N-acetyltransferase GlmU [Oleiagrimonas sp.]|jgi:bifunctional UDP-N-acetylglucosamine pyrophosphorylase/glucosamine-1-phosphate N-acetyltransferase|uniref:bifunctional UDP-N-acetylglucosamine diphosphorylase/glucosamine-1-phosphate N-acetyltransferase GlmU n=1 Tax=Oleiagrimonas sp. TaxID=2010330 RepID=UPI002610A542|nr:bifunctional UDP-N-acetylglucosamine diphosphorylase/glucosamine-1-phosphate N-acetyltransferase GlmU [Oleiagrimonas sp.]MDA3913483.1 bifunctional UDP-N-acetylglucosamine diphosphorylase/glucosamine-1-phosphate N-acetyltransferase GlmU [Oleiagrimonas sp.]
MSRSLHVIVLAAGEGKRMKSCTAKVLLPLAGRPMLAHVLDTAYALDPECVHVVYGHRGDQVRAAFESRDRLVWVEQAQQLGTGHAVRLAMEGVPDGSRVLVLYGDVPLMQAAALQPLVAADATLAVLAAQMDDPSGYGRVLLGEHDRVRAIVEDKDATAEQRSVRLTNTGIVAADAAPMRAWVAALGNANAQGEYYLTDVFSQAADAGDPASCVRMEDPREASGANTPWQLAELESLYRQRRARELAESGVRIADPARFDVRGTVQAGRDVEIDVDVILEGEVVLGDKVRIGPFCRLRDVCLSAGTVVHAHCDLDGVVTEGACKIGPFARLRPGARLAEGAQAGNFVEMKKARLGPDSKANHLAYLGDTEIGSGVNIGAGTITCNYDGVNKHHTRIEDGAFIGSNSALVAPVTIGAQATIGAGSTVSGQIPAGKLTLARARQTTLSGWRRPLKREPE